MLHSRGTYYAPGRWGKQDKFYDYFGTNAVIVVTVRLSLDDAGEGQHVCERCVNTVEFRRRQSREYGRRGCTAGLWIKKKSRRIGTLQKIPRGEAFYFAFSARWMGSRVTIIGMK